jgi:hypothetical protein
MRTAGTKASSGALPRIRLALVYRRILFSVIQQQDENCGEVEVVVPNYITNSFISVAQYCRVKVSYTAAYTLGGAGKWDT